MSLVQQEAKMAPDAPMIVAFIANHKPGHASREKPLQTSLSSENKFCYEVKLG